MSLRLRLTLLNSLILLLVGGALVASVYAVLVQSLQRQVDDSLREQARLYGANASVILARGPRGPVPSRVQLPNLERFAGSNTFIQLAGRSGEIQASSENLGDETLPLPPEALAAAVAGREWLATVEVDGQPLRQLVAPLRISGPPLPPGSPAAASPLVIQVARPLAPVSATLRTLEVTILVVGTVGVLVALLAGWLLARAALRPIYRLAATADTIATERDLARRVPLAGPQRDEIGRLATAFNHMLAELQRAHEQLVATLSAQRRFVADASHELRTPLATLRGNIDLLRHMGGSPGSADTARGAILADLGAEAERMSRLVADLLLLAQADAGQHLTLSRVDAGQVAREAARAAPLLATNGVAFEAAEVPDGLWVSGHADRLRQVLLVLLDNALKYTPVGGQVGLRAERARRDGYEGEWVALRVADTGPGIPPEDQARIFDRFYRGAGARSGEGTGLGLAIARWIVAEHHGTLELQSAPGGAVQGSVFTLWLPAEPAPTGREAAGLDSPAVAPRQPVSA